MKNLLRMKFALSLHPHFRKILQIEQYNKSPGYVPRQAGKSVRRCMCQMVIQSLMLKRKIKIEY